VSMILTSCSCCTPRAEIQYFKASWRAQCPSAAKCNTKHRANGASRASCFRATKVLLPRNEAKRAYTTRKCTPQPQTARVACCTSAHSKRSVSKSQVKWKRCVRGACLLQPSANTQVPGACWHTMHWYTGGLCARCTAVQWLRPLLP
jgi:hypothetical protein